MFCFSFFQEFLHILETYAKLSAQQKVIDLVNVVHDLVDEGAESE